MAQDSGENAANNEGDKRAASDRGTQQRDSTNPEFEFLHPEDQPERPAEPTETSLPGDELQETIVADVSEAFHDQEHVSLPIRSQSRSSSHSTILVP